MKRSKPWRPRAASWASRKSACSSARPSRRDRKSTRLNSSHGYISYAAFCLDKQTRAAQGPLTRLPDLDVVITSYNKDLASLRSFLESLLAQDYPGVVRTYLVDDAIPNRAPL